MAVVCQVIKNKQAEEVMDMQDDLSCDDLDAFARSCGLVLPGACAGDFETMTRLLSLV